jgi:hypothetical protein
MSGLIRRFTIPARHAIPAKSGQIHHVNILHISSVLKMRHKTAKSGGFKFGRGGLIHCCRKLLSESVLMIF